MLKGGKKRQLEDGPTSQIGGNLYIKIHSDSNGLKPTD